MPSKKEIYPEKTVGRSKFSFGGLDQRLEGAFRPGHFDGVADVVNRLLMITGPNYLYMGQKDYQQVQIVRQMIAQSGLKVELSMEPIVRESNGLAMSSRNVRISERKAKSGYHPYNSAMG